MILAFIMYFFQVCQELRRLFITSINHAHRQKHYKFIHET